ncbi:hypothetical protein JCM3765_005589 [Sporobolomyces pararoseus]
MSRIVPSTPAPQPPQPATAPLAASPLVSSPPIALQLLLSQAVCKLGTGAGWLSISQLVESSEEWPENAAKMTQQGYESAFNDLMGTRGLDASACSQPQARPVRKLIHSLYSELLISLRDQILSSHAQEMKLKSEIQQISSGSVDNLLFNSASQPIKEKLLENQRSKDQEEVARRGQEQLQQSTGTLQTSIPSETLTAQPTIPAPTNENVSKAEDTGASSSGQPQEESATAESGNQDASTQGDVSMKDSGETTEDTSHEAAQEDGDVAVEAEEEAEGGEEEEEKSPTKKRARRTAGGGRRGRKRATTGGRGRTKKEVAAAEENAEEEDGEGEGEEEENQEGEDGGEEEEEVEGEEGAAAEEEGEQDEKKPASSRKRGPPSRKAKRKASEPTPPTANSPAAGEGENTAPANKRTKRGGRKSRADTEADQEGATDSTGAESKESKQLTARRKTAYTRILETIRTSLPFSSSFDTKVTKSQAPNYSAAVQRPTCLRDIGKKIKNGEIKDNSELMREFAIMCANAVQFNGVEGEVSVGRQAQELWEAFERQVSLPLLSSFTKMGVADAALLDREMNETLSTEFLVENSSA